MTVRSNPEPSGADLLAEKALSQTILDAQQDTVFLFDPASNRAVRWNKAFREASGYTDEEIAALPAPQSYYSADDLERAADATQEVMEAGAATVEMELICKDGSRVPTEYKAGVVRAEDGAPKFIIAVGRDITERLEAVEALRVHRERLLRFMDSATDSFHLVDADLRILEINEAALGAIRAARGADLDVASVVGKSLLEVYPFLRDKPGEEVFRRVLSDGAPVTVDHSAAHPVSGTIHMTTKVFRVGRDLGIIATDISERKRAEERRLELERQVQSAQKLESLGILAGGVAHDFNNILVSILGYADLARQDLSDNAAGRDHLEQIVLASRRAADLASQMLAYSGKGRFEVMHVDLSDLVAEMKTLLGVSTSKRSTLRLDLDDALPAIQADPTQVRQIVMNLTTNASDALADRHGLIEITTSVVHLDGESLDGSWIPGDPAAQACVCLEIADDGVGMDTDTQARLFDPFFTTKFTGRGLGMAVVLGIIRGHEAGIRVDSAPGEGTRVKVLFPAVDAEADALDGCGGAGAGGGAGDGEPWGAGGTILLVDDEDTVLDIGKRILERFGFDVLTAADGKQALDAFTQHQDEIVCVILDFTMPVMDGEECFRQLRRIKSDVRVLLSSGFNEQEVSERFGGQELAGFIKKPYLMATLENMLRKLLES